MGRKSRRKEDSLEPQPAQAVRRAAIYARLSVENSGKEDGGASMENQVAVCREYLAGCPDLEPAGVYEDNGWTGTSMRRPAFERMMEDAAKGEIGAIVVRDLSRFARNYIEMGTYLEQVLPGMGIRLVSVKEGLDTGAGDGSGESLMVPLQNLVNDLYSKDISRKVSAALHAQMEEGSFKWRRLPYGYMWDGGHTNIVPDPCKAGTVLDIFRWRSEGASIGEIQERLDAAGIPTPTGMGTGRWARSTVQQILRNPAYIGQRVCGCTLSSVGRGLKKARQPKEQWHVTEGAHEAIVPEGTYRKVQEIAERHAGKRRESMERTRRDREKLEDLFEGKILCADCGRRMYFHRHRMDCRDRHWQADYYCSSQAQGRHAACSAHYITKDGLDGKVLEVLRTQALVAADYESLIKKYRGTSGERAHRARMDREIRDASARLEDMKRKRTRLYEDYADGILDADEYAYARDAYESGYREAEKEYSELLAKKKEHEEAMSPRNRWVAMLKRLHGAEALDRGLVDAMVECVRIHEGGDIELELKYRDVFELTRDCLEGKAQEMARGDECEKNTAGKKGDGRNG